MTDMTVATTIRDQIRAIDPMALFAWGATGYVGTEDSLRFKSSGMVEWKGIVVIKLNSMDLYDLEFGKARGSEYKVVATESDVYAEDLVKFIDAQVG